MRRRAPAIAGALGALLIAGRADGGPRVFSLDQCADQYVLALSPPADIAALSTRALNADSYLASRAREAPRRRATLESILAARPEVVVRYWGGDEPLLTAVRRRGIKVVRIGEAADFAGLRTNLREVGAALGQEGTAERLIAGMDRELAAAAAAWGGAAGLYLTAGGATAGRGVLIDGMMAAAGLRNVVAGRGFRSISMERVVLEPPRVFVLGFFDSPGAGFQRWSAGRQDAVRRAFVSRPTISLPASVLDCPAWFAADGVRAIAAARRPS